MNDDFAELRRALWAGPTLGARRAVFDIDRGWIVRHESGSVLATLGWSCTESGDPAEQDAELIAVATPEILESLLWSHDARAAATTAAARQATAATACIGLLDTLIAHYGQDLDDLDPTPLAVAICDLESATDDLAASIQSITTDGGNHDPQHRITDDAQTA